MGLAFSSLLIERPLAPLAHISGCWEQVEMEFDADLPPLEEITDDETKELACEDDCIQEDGWRLVLRRGCCLSQSPPEMAVGVCMVCFDEGYVLQLECQHTMCKVCLHAQLAARWPGSRMTFGYLNCGACRTPLMHPSVEDVIAEHEDLRQKAVRVAVAQYEADDLHRDLKRLLRRNPMECEVAKHAEAEMAVYMCHDCREPFCGGRVDCIQALERDSRVQDLCCQECKFNAMGRKDHRCIAHGPRFAVYKCESCCNVASWICAGGNHYCDRCHVDACSEKHYPCPGPSLCPLGMAHPPNGLGVLGSTAPGFVVGCTACMGCIDQNEDKGSEWGEDHSGWVEPVKRVKPCNEAEDVRGDDFIEADWMSWKERRAAMLSTSRLRKVVRCARTTMAANVAMGRWESQRTGCWMQRLTQSGGKDAPVSIFRGAPSKRRVMRGGRHKVSLVAVEDVHMEVDSP